MAPPQRLSEAEMELKFSELKMDQLLSTCTTKRIDRNSYHSPIKHKREYGMAYMKDGRTVAIIFFFDGPGGEQQRSIRLLDDGQTIYSRE